MNGIRSMLKYFTPYTFLLGVFLFSLLVEVAYGVAAPLSLQYLVDEALLPKNFQVFLLILGILIVGGLINIAAGIGGDFALGKLSGEGIRKLRTELFDHLQRQSFSFYHRYRTGDLVTRFSGDMSSVERVIRVSTPMFLKELLAVLLGLVLLFSIEWKLTLVMVAGSALMFVGPRLLQRRAEDDNTGYKEAQERFSNTIDEAVKGHKTIKSLHQQGRFRERARGQIHNLFSAGLKLHMTNSLMERLPLTALMILNGTMLGYGGYLIFHDEMTIGGFMAFFTLFMSVGQSGSNLSFLIPSLIESGVSFKRIGEILAHKPEVAEAAAPWELPSSFRKLRMEEVTFGYNGTSDQLKDVSLEIAAGSYVAFVGPSGSGKSTALQLLARFYDPRQGTVFMDDSDLRTVSEASLRKLSVLVTQDTFLFNSTIRDNLLLDSAEATEADMVEAARNAGIHQVIEGWTEGYDTWIHQEGATLSGGERQRIALARALLRKPKLLLLDEVTSALDPASESDINAWINRMRGERTIISVTHRLASVIQADNIYVFQDGKVVESGTHQELLRRQGLYDSLWQKQQGFHLSQDGLRASVEVERLAKLPFFRSTELGLLQEVSGLFSTETCKEGESVVHEGEEGDKFYIIVRGKFEVLKMVPGEGDTRVAWLQDGDHFGEVALLRNARRNATVRAAGPAVLLSVRREAFHRLLDQAPHMLAELQRTLELRS
ncbi:ATP-binding cassette, subfamily B [Paenibacillus sp. UNCCL117]|uniref:ABC transporter transmembrane domain-containing protein n=1 Tax=unclassified Paenibacillus TaxID=185978 RepID=UPI000886202F|nr:MULTISPECIES: ABC transporter transmembrane domain-containing protein [unclassified Paenibacillus]SDE44480.1 ATP-binding cassette, subfamily B [Paenibacillus sp. cl123]SFW46282.1 ATP-binding cassette, subfamily B [Paenibacillus sp. UNCCL117]